YINTNLSSVFKQLAANNIQVNSYHKTAAASNNIVGSVLSIVGCCLRIHCYRALGRMFTYELSIRKDHKLITSGVYAIVRHPSYTGGICSGVGLLPRIISPHSWLVACSPLFPDSGWMVNVLAYTLISVFVGLIAVLVHRMNNEDAMLEKNFGEEWKKWARRVPCRLVPWVY
ncbi:hypothetical protein PAXINDRAFT_89819, partial [Paxillus involutus ATCC 200175]